ncbi:TonB-dependent receptor [Novosphingobium resinovorum]|uniref:TonB-dependent receptor n=2 Tax=Novosphingobium TaxID=165696 RepID=A0A031JPP8_9SPHN|nr:TonB-dependent receptor [Novosphingobium resinovorum]AOR79227.1 hypothetical protein BES08_20370 [Novosphingobium resinovorum]EZP79756.1 TonB-dependent receptor precursor [Novosphingobium resinovorum]WJM24660.1 TonB-dependent receptor [Novosphingobium resinovorum]
MNRSRNFLLAASTCALALMGSQAASAQSAEASADTGTGLGDIVVTAEKRPTLLQKTPLAISVIDAEAIKANGVGNLQDLAGVAPGFNFSNNGAQTILTVRGVSSRDTSEIGDPAVALSIDGIYFQRALGLNATMFDVERIEVLRGPQGTLLGRNSTGGSINIVSAKPVDHFEANVSGEIGNYDTFITQGMVNLPVTDTLQVRAAFQTRDHSGYRNNPVGRDGDDERSKAARLSVLFKPTDRLTIDLIGEYSHLGGVGPVRQGITPVTGADGEPDITVKPPIPGDGKSWSQTDGAYVKGDTYFLRWNADYDLDFATVTYLGGYRNLDYTRNALDEPVYGSNRQNMTFFQHEKPVTWNHEVRLTSQLDGPFRFQVGGFYFREKNSVDAQFRDYPGKNAVIGDYVLLARYYYPDTVTTSRAVFGQAAYKLTDQLEVEGGIRYTHDKKHRSGSYTSTDGDAYLETGAINYESGDQYGRSSDKVTTYHAGLNYQFTPQNMAYFKFDTGFKSGGFTDNSAYGPEKITSYEIGLKNRFFGGTLQVNVDAFWYDYKDQQVSQFIIRDDGFSSIDVYNAGKSRYKGVEADVTWLATPADHFDAYVAYVHAEYTDFAVADGDGNLQLAGNVPPQAPRWSANFGYSHDFDLGFGTLTARAQTHIESKSYFSFYNWDSEKQSGYTKSDLMLTYKPADKAWSVEAYVRNLEDKLILTGTGPASTQIAYQYAAPRTYGIRASFDF